MIVQISNPVIKFIFVTTQYLHMSCLNKVLESLEVWDHKDDSLTIEHLKFNYGDVEKDTALRYEPDYEPSAVAAQAFGQSQDKESYNHILAENVLAAKEIYGEDLPVIAQGEVVNCIYNIDEEINDENLYQVFDQSEESEFISDYPTTRVMEEVESIVDEQDFNSDELLFTGHNAHMRRILYTAEKEGLEGKPFMRDEVTWPEDDGQEWVQSPENWWKRELASRAHHWTHYNVPFADQMFEELGI